MSKEFDELKRLASQDEAKIKARKKERYNLARSLGFSAAMSRRVMGFSKEKIEKLSKEL